MLHSYILFSVKLAEVAYISGSIKEGKQNGANFIISSLIEGVGITQGKVNNMKTKICIKCKKEKLLTEFYKRWHNKNRNQKYYYHSCKDCRNKDQIIYNQYRQLKHAMIKESKRKYEQKRRKEDTNYQIINNLRTRIWWTLKNSSKSKRTMDLLGCTINELKQHLEDQFQPEMTWNNYGKWHIDHIKPCSLFDMTKESEQKKCFNYKNLQPLWAEDNLKKYNKMEESRS